MLGRLYRNMLGINDQKVPKYVFPPVDIFPCTYSISKQAKQDEARRTVGSNQGLVASESLLQTSDLRMKSLKVCADSPLWRLQEPDYPQPGILSNTCCHLLDRRLIISTLEESLISSGFFRWGLYLENKFGIVLLSEK